MKISGSAFGFILLLTGFAYSLWQVGTRRIEETDPSTRTLRIGHWLIHAGMRESMDAIIADYERLHPDVRIKQNTVPIKTWFAWQRAQWTGGNTPDLMQLGKGTNDDTIARYYTALTPYVDQPNPYNVGTPLEGLPWRKTFVEGLGSGGVFYHSFSEIFGIPAQVNTLRLYYNRDLLREITGSEQPPSTPEELIALRPAVDAWRARTGQAITPLALCGPYGEFLLDRISASMTQSLALELNPTRALGENTLFNTSGFLDGTWSLERPEVRRALEYWAEIAALSPPGYHQLPREEALFNFVTGRSLLFFAGSWDYAGILQEARFSTGVTTFPMPVAGLAPWGEFSLGAVSEADSGMECILGISRDSRDPELALDFLRFLTSHSSAVKFTQISRRISAVIDVPAPPELEEMRPVTTGAFNGMNLTMRYIAGGNAGLMFSQNIHLLDARHHGATAAADAFIAAVNPLWPAALKRDLAAFPRSRLQIVRQADVRQTFAALREQDPAALDLLGETALDAEIALAQFRELRVP